MNAVAALELRRHIETPATWLLLAGTQATLGWIFLDQLERYEQLAPLLSGLPSAPGVTASVGVSVLSAAALAMLAMTPLLAARGAADERASGMTALLESAPLSSGEIVRGKWLATFAVLLMAALGALSLPLSLAVGTPVDLGLLAAAALGLIGLAAALAALATLCSLISPQPLVAAAIAFAVLLLGWVLGSAANMPGLQGLAWLSPAVHLRSALQGVFDSRDIAWFAMFAGAQLVLAHGVLDAQRSARR